MRRGALALLVLLGGLFQGCGGPSPAPVTHAQPTPVAQSQFVPEELLDIRYRMALALNAEGEWRAALVHLQRLLDERANHWVVQLSYGTALFWLQGDLTQVAEALERSIELNPSNPRALTLLGLVFEQRDELAAAEESLRASLAIREASDTQMALARVLRSQEKLEDAEQVLSEIVGANPDLLRARLQLARTQHELGQWQQAEENYRQYAQRHPQPALGYRKLLAFYKATGQQAKATELQEEIRRISEEEDSRQLRPLLPSAR